MDYCCPTFQCRAACPNVLMAWEQSRLSLIDSLRSSISSVACLQIAKRQNKHQLTSKLAVGASFIFWLLSVHVFTLFPLAKIIRKLCGSCKIRTQCKRATAPAAALLLILRKFPSQWRTHSSHGPPDIAAHPPRVDGYHRRWERT